MIYGYSSPSPIPSASEASPRPIRYSPLPSHRTVHHGVHPVLSNTGGTTTLHQSAIPLYKHHEPAAPLAPSQPSGIPVYQQQTTASPKHKSSSSFFNTFSRGMKSGGRGDKVIDRGGTAAPPTMMSGATDRSLYAGTTTTNTSHQTALYQHHHQGQPNTSSMLHRHGALGGMSNGGGGGGAGLAMPEGSKEDAGNVIPTASYKHVAPLSAPLLQMPLTVRLRSVACYVCGKRSIESCEGMCVTFAIHLSNHPPLPFERPEPIVG